MAWFAHYSLNTPSFSSSSMILVIASFTGSSARCDSFLYSWSYLLASDSDNRMWQEGSYLLSGINSSRVVSMSRTAVSTVSFSELISMYSGAWVFNTSEIV